MKKRKFEPEPYKPLSSFSNEPRPDWEGLVFTTTPIIQSLLRVDPTGEVHYKLMQASKKYHDGFSTRKNLLQESIGGRLIRDRKGGIFRKYHVDVNGEYHGLYKELEPVLYTRKPYDKITSIEYKHGKRHGKTQQQTFVEDDNDTADTGYVFLYENDDYIGSGEEGEDISFSSDLDNYPTVPSKNIYDMAGFSEDSE